MIILRQKIFANNSNDKKELSSLDKTLLGITGAGLSTGIGGSLVSNHLEDRAIDKARDLLNDYYGIKPGKEDISNIRDGIRKNYTPEIKAANLDYDDMIRYQVKRSNDIKELRNIESEFDKLAKKSRKIKKLGKAGFITAGTTGTILLGKKIIDEIKKKEKEKEN